MWRMARMRNVLIALTLGYAPAVFSQEVTLKDFVLGGDLTAQAERAGLACGPSPMKGSREIWCRRTHSGPATDLSRTIGGVEAKGMFISGFENKLGSIYYSFDQSNFSLIRAGLREKYPGLRCNDSTVQNRAGASFEQTECEISSETARLVATRRGSDISTGSVQVISTDHRQQMEAELKQRAGSAKKDL
jgi:hypothetical protein